MSRWTKYGWGAGIVRWCAYIIVNGWRLAIFRGVNSLKWQMTFGPNAWRRDRIPIPRR